MRYMGGKSKISKPIAEIINRSLSLGGQTFVSLFCGACSVEAKIKANTKILNDIHPYLIAMWKGLQNGWEPPSIITKDEYYYIKEHKKENPALTGFVGFGCSFGGKWFGGLACNKRGDNFCSNARNSLMRDFNYLKNATFLNMDYREVPIPDGSVVYCDPPYINTTKYATGNFNHKEFWEYMRQLSQRCTVFISEQTAPEDFKPIWQQEVKRTIDNVNHGFFNKTEKVFILR